MLFLSGQRNGSTGVAVRGGWEGGGGVDSSVV